MKIRAHTHAEQGLPWPRRLAEHVVQARARAMNKKTNYTHLRVWKEENIYAYDLIRVCSLQATSIPLDRINGIVHIHVHTWKLAYFDTGSEMCSAPLLAALQGYGCVLLQ